MNSQTFGEKIRARRKSMNLSLKEVAVFLKMSPTTLSKIERNLKTAPEKNIEPLAKILSMSYKELMLKYLSEYIFYNVKDLDFAQEAIDKAKNRLIREGKGTKKIKKKEDVFHIIKQYFSSKPVKKAWVFGSFARNSEISFDSDIDILIRLDKNNKFTYFDFVGMKEDLEVRTGRTIDLVIEGSERPSLKENIHREKRIVYG